jgi:hypothetical protein
MMMSSSNNNNNGNYRSVNGSLRESLVGGRNIPVGSQYHRRGHSLTGGGVFSKDNHNKDENLDLFSKNRRSLSVASSDESSDGMFWIFFTSFVPGDALGGFLRFLQFFHGDARMKKMMVWSFC